MTVGDGDLSHDPGHRHGEQRHADGRQRRLDSRGHPHDDLDVAVGMGRADAPARRRSINWSPILYNQLTIQAGDFEDVDIEGTPTIQVITFLHRLRPLRRVRGKLVGDDREQRHLDRARLGLRDGLNRRGHPLDRRRLLGPFRGSAESRRHRHRRGRRRRHHGPGGLRLHRDSRHRQRGLRRHGRHVRVRRRAWVSTSPPYIVAPSGETRITSILPDHQSIQFNDSDINFTLDDDSLPVGRVRRRRLLHHQPWQRTPSRTTPRTVEPGSTPLANEVVLENNGVADHHQWERRHRWSTSPRTTPTTSTSTPASRTASPSMTRISKSRRTRRRCRTSRSPATSLYGATTGDDRLHQSDRLHVRRPIRRP